jgi:hypothetical protein
LIIFSVFHSIKEDKIVNVLNNYDKVNRIIIVKNGKEKTITDNKLQQYKEAFEPKDILEGYKKEIKKVLGKKVIDVSYYIDDKKLLESSIYELSRNFEHGSFNVDDSHYIMKVDSDFRSVKNTNMNFLKDLSDD